MVAAAPHRSAAGLWSRHAGARATVPSSRDSPRDFVRAVASLAASHGRLAVYPGQESSVGALLDHADLLPPEVVSPYTDAAAPRRLREKAELADLARDAGLRAPRTIAVGTAAELAASAPEVPCAVKPARPGGVLESTRVVPDASALGELLRTLPADEPLLVQEHVDGPLTALALVTAGDGRLVARFQQEARRTWPPRAGSSAIAVSVEPDEDLAERGAALMHAAGYSGLAQFQFIRGGDGLALIDVNPRFYGSLPLALAAGVNLPAAWHAVVAGQGLPEPGAYRAGVTFRWLEADLMAAADGSPRALLGRAPRPRAGAVWSAADPVPAALLTYEAVAARLPKLARALPRRSR